MYTNDCTTLPISTEAIVPARPNASVAGTSTASVAAALATLARVSRRTALIPWSTYPTAPLRLYSGKLRISRPTSGWYLALPVRTNEMCPEAGSRTTHAASADPTDRSAALPTTRLVIRSSLSACATSFATPVVRPSGMMVETNAAKFRSWTRMPTADGPSATA